LKGFAAPVEQTYPALAPYIELLDGRTIVATDGADFISPSADGQSLRIRWSHWSVLGGQPGQRVDVGLTSEVKWHIHGNTLLREETLTSSKPVKIRRWWMAVPSTYGNLSSELHNGARTDRFYSGKEGLEVQLTGETFRIKRSVMAAGDGPLGKGVHGAIPLHLVFEAENLDLNSGALKYRLTLTPLYIE
jgi:hypothetical protein